LTGPVFNYKAFRQCITASVMPETFHNVLEHPWSKKWCGSWWF